MPASSPEATMIQPISPWNPSTRPIKASRRRCARKGPHGEADEEEAAIDDADEAAELPVAKLPPIDRLEVGNAHPGVGEPLCRLAW